jgi:TonB family protein
MRVLVVDQDSASNEAIARSLRELFTVDAVTNKGDCLDLLRSNTFEVIVAAERLEDGSGLELLGQVAKKWPAVLRIFAADRQRLALLKGRLGPFELFQTLSYPIDPERLIASVSLAEAAQQAHADTSTIQHVVLTAESLLEEADEFPTPQPLPRAAATGHSQRGPGNARGSSRTTPQRARTTSTPSLGGARPSHHRPRGASRPQAVRFPPRERTPPLEAPRDFRSNASQSDSLGEVAAIARAAQPNFEPSPTENFDTRSLVIRVGVGAAAALAVALLGFRLFGSSKGEGSPPVPAQVVRVPQYLPAPVPDTVATPKDNGAQSVAAHSASKRSGSRHGETGAVGSGAAENASQPLGDADRGAAVANSASAGTDRTGAAANSVSSAAMADHEPTLPPETPPGLTRVSNTSTANLAATTAPATNSPAASTINAAAASTAAESAVPTVGGSNGPGGASASATSIPAAPQQVFSAEQSPPPAASTHRPSSSEPPPVIREAKLIRRVTPDYPSAAKHDGIVGSVDLEVTVSPQGVVDSVSVVRANPPDLFEKSAMTAVRKWKYDPRFVDGLPAEAHLNVHLDFGPNQ